MADELSFETTLFGTLKFAGGDGFTENFTISAGGREFRTTLDIWEDFVTAQNHAQVRAFLENIPALYEKARGKIESSYQTDAMIRSFISEQLQELEEEPLLDYFDVEELSQVTPERFIQKLEPRTIWISPVRETEGEIDCTFDFSLDEELTDELLVIRFNQSMELYELTWES